MKLVVKLLVGIVLGIILGLVSPEFVIRLFVTVKGIFGSFIGFIIPFIILFFIASGVAGLGKKSGSLVGKTVGFAYLSTLIAGLLAFFVAIIFIPFISTGQAAIAEGSSFEPFIKLEITPLMGVITALVTAFLFGIGMAKTNSKILKVGFDEGKNIIDLVISKIIIPFLPFYIASIFAELAAVGTVFDTLKVFGVVLVLAIATHWVWLIIQYAVAGAISGKNPFSLIKNMLPAYFTAIGTMSSAATIPVTLRSVKRNKVKNEVADFGVPLCATIHLSGSVITIVLCAVAVMMLTPDLAEPSFGAMLPVIFMLGIIMIAAPGVPGGAIMAALGVLTTMLGFGEAAIGLMIALYMAQDSFGTATNVTGDGAINVIIDKTSNVDAVDAN
ncbi:dicarboxylate/amino acid:cation symporter [Anaerobacillus alkalidiazotrophicus]|uniref:Dicarboxylate/amino acid:cation symporter n=1 Tax=Anaerobacillus alkalidiazotrophicus TaxID=472963 RepID=A0A1S2MAG7_9BACI|nr:dicarboxylate/amino acid:cation symporter [Anaerobacillus alkalidiazotrophicus]OIJ20817.1 dicarboxylate/amino acid:cation symporter [Anaerobacillus alkalidiazotrophicus]